MPLPTPTLIVVGGGEGRREVFKGNEMFPVCWNNNYYVVCGDVGQPVKESESLLLLCLQWVWVVVGKIAGGGCECFGLCWERRKFKYTI